MLLFEFNLRCDVESSILSNNASRDPALVVSKLVLRAMLHIVLFPGRGGAAGKAAKAAGKAEVERTKASLAEGAPRRSWHSRHTSVFDVRYGSGANNIKV